MKKLINRPEDVVGEMMEGLGAMYGGLALLSDFHVLVRADAEEIRDRQVALISGGGSGHEPAHAGYVGAGMLSAAVAGEVFTSPSPDSVLAAIRAVAGKPGAVLIVKNYTGDRLNFGLAAEMARAEGLAVEVVIVADDVALAGTEQYAGARGIAGTVFVHKVAGAAAAQGKRLREVAAIARQTAEAVATMGVALSAGTIPAVGKASFVLGEQEVELGLGIHGEPGTRRIPLSGADDLAGQLVEAIVSTQQLKANDSVAVLVNNLGSTTGMELAIFARSALGILAATGVTIKRVYAGTFMTSLEAAGVSLSVLRVTEDRLKALDAPTNAAAWPSSALPGTGVPPNRLLDSRHHRPVPKKEWPQQPFDKMQRAVQAVCVVLEQSETRLTELDRVVGDGDLGANLARGAKAIEEILSMFHGYTPAEVLKVIGFTIQKTVGGSSGALYAAFLLRAATSIRDADADNPKDWAAAFLEGCRAIGELGEAKEGDRTMLDALLPAARTLADHLNDGRSIEEALEAAATAAEQGAEATASMPPRRGRSSYLGERVIGHRDPGAMAAALWLRSVAFAASSGAGGGDASASGTRGGLRR